MLCVRVCYALFVSVYVYVLCSLLAYCRVMCLCVYIYIYIYIYIHISIYIYIYIEREREIVLYLLLARGLLRAGLRLVAVRQALRGRSLLRPFVIVAYVCVVC